MTNYAVGAAFERRVAAALETDGYYVQRAAGSKGVCDLVAIKTGQVLLVQVKRLNGQLKPVDRKALVELAKRCGADPVVAYQPVPRKPIVYRVLTGTGPSDWTPWFADEAELPQEYR